MKTVRPQAGGPNEEGRGEILREAEEAILPLDVMIARHIERALRKTGGRIEGPNGAATLLKLHPNTLRSKMKRLSVPFPSARKGRSRG